MDENRIALKKEIELHRNELVLQSSFSGQVVKLLDAVDGEEDYYWVYLIDHLVGGKRALDVIHSSCVGNLIFLKGKIDDRDYKSLELQWKLNVTNMYGEEAIEQFIEKSKRYPSI